MNTEEAVWCALCGASAQVAWCPAWQVHLCPSHVFERTYKELDATDRPDGWGTALARDVARVVL